MAYIIAVDIGTSSTKVILFNEQCEIVYKFKAAYITHTPQHNYSEQNPSDIYNAVADGINACFNAVTSPNDILCVSFSAAMHSLIVVNDLGEALTPCIIWSDNRAHQEAEAINKQTRLANRIYKISGTPIHAMSPMVKLAWLKKNQSHVFEKAHKFLGIKEFVLWRLSGKYITDYSMASATGMFDVSKKKWSKQILKLIGIAENKLPEVVSPYYITQFEPNHSSQFSTILKNVSLFKIVIGGTDGALANLGSINEKDTAVALSIGTSSAIRFFSETPFFDYKRRTFCYAFDESQFLIGGGANSGAGVLQWLHDAFFKSNQSIHDFLESAENIPVGSDGLIFLPYISGERAPLWDSDIRGMYWGLSSEHTQANAVRAAMEGVAMHLALLKNILSENHEINTIVASGGFAETDLWVQIVADVLNCSVRILDSVEASARGAAILSLTSLEKKSTQNFSFTKTFAPNLENTPKYVNALMRFEKIYAAVKKF